MGESAPELTAELIVDGAVPSQPVISPDGAWVAYQVAPMGMTEPAVSALWVAAADGRSPPRELAAVTGRESLPRWAPDSASVYFRSAGQLHRIRLDGAAAQALTSWRSEVSDYCPLADGAVAVIAADGPTEEDERRKAERDDAMVYGQRTPRHRLRLLDLGTGALRTVPGLAGRHVVEIAQRPDGGPLAVLSWSCPDIYPGAATAGLHVADPATGAVQDLGRAGLEACSLAWWSDDRDGWHLGYLALAPPSLTGLAVFDVTVPAAGPAVEHRDLTAGMTSCPAELVQVAGGSPLALFAEGLDTAIGRLDPGTRRFRRVSARRGLLVALSVSRSGAAVAGLASTSYEPKDVYAGPPGGPLARLSDTRPELRQIRHGTQERLCYQASDALGLDGVLVLPAGKSRADGPFPLVTMVHGGPYDRHADEFYGGPFSPGQWLAAAGFAVFLPNPRGGSGHGQEFAAAVAGRAGLEEWTDIVSGIDLLIADGVADPARLGIGGYSHGGFMAAWAVGQTGRFKAALMGAGISDWGMLAGTGDFGPSEAILSGSCGWEGPGPHRHDQLSPISFASKIRTPVLILHGQEDTNVPLGQSVYFHRALSAYGVEHEFVVYPREGHGSRERNHQIDLLRRTRAWFGRWLGPPEGHSDPFRCR